MRIYRGRAQRKGRRGSHHRGSYIQGQEAAHRAQWVPHILVCEYSSRVRNYCTKFTSVFLLFVLPHRNRRKVRTRHRNRRKVRTRIARGCHAATRTTTVSEVLYAASDFFVMTVVVPLLVALDDIHHRAGGSRAQFHCHADAPLKLSRATSQ